jgi:acetyltransferase-like isoleucine patch superfamily enzyme/dTDP-4-dehydrorhamnose 3,5-epimerase-like enzyme
MFKHELSLVETDFVGKGTRIWAFAHVLPGAKIGRDCNICDHTFIEGDVTVGDRVTVKCGVQLWDGITIEDDVFIGPNATFTNDRFPRSKRHQAQDKMPRTLIRAGASIGATAKIMPCLIIGERAMGGAGAVVTRDVPPDTIVIGNPASIVGYVDAKTADRAIPAQPSSAARTEETTVQGVRLLRLPLIEDLRGWLSFGEMGKHVPFEVKRYFLVFGVTGRHIRGEHAHKCLHQFLICVKGSCNVVADDGRNREEFVLDQPCIGLHLPPLIWSVQYKYSEDAVLLVLASDFYDPEDYIRSYKDFLNLVAVPT